MKLSMKKYIINFLFILYLEVIYHLFVFKSFCIRDVIYIISFTIINSLFIDICTSLFKKNINKYLNYFIYIFLVILFITYFINYRFYGNTLSIYSIFHGGQVFGFMDAIARTIKNNIIYILLFILPSLIFIKKREYYSLCIKDILIKSSILISLFIIILLSLNINKGDIYSSYNLYFNKHVPNQTVQNFGVLTTLRLDIKRTLTNFSEGTVTNNDIVNEDNNIEYNKLDIDFNSLIENEDSDIVKEIHSFVSSSSASEKNKYTGMFKGKNLIVITAEAFSPIAVNKDITPTLYKLVNSGFNFTNFYSPIYYTSTSDGEYVSLTSLLPKESTWSFSKSKDNYLPYVYGNVFVSMGYNTFAFHNGTYKYYNRHLSHPNMGYNTYMACGNGLEKISGMHCKKWPQSDLEMINATFDMYSSGNFLTYYMTISGHLEYNFNGNNMAYKNKDLVKDLPYSEAIKSYYATQIELDKALEELLTKLENKGILDDTVIVLSADHYPYGLSINEIKEVMPINDEKFDIHKNNLIIYNSTLKKKITIDKIGESLDILPTVLNLFGIDFDSRLLMGTDLLSSKDGIVIFNDRSWITSRGKYDASNKSFTSYSGEIDNDYIDSINTLVYNKFVISKNILDTDYYRKVFKED